MILRHEYQYNKLLCRPRLPHRVTKVDWGLHIRSVRHELPQLTFRDTKLQGLWSSTQPSYYIHNQQLGLRKSEINNKLEIHPDKCLLKTKFFASAISSLIISRKLSSVSLHSPLIVEPGICGKNTQGRGSPSARLREGTIQYVPQTLIHMSQVRA